MNKQDLDAILSAMIHGVEKSVSDLVFVTGKPPQVEKDGRLEALAMDGPDEALNEAHLESMSDILMQTDPRLRADFDLFARNRGPVSRQYLQTKWPAWYRHAPPAIENSIAH
jgi:hypothetical protein